MSPVDDIPLPRLRVPEKLPVRLPQLARLPHAGHLAEGRPLRFHLQPVVRRTRDREVRVHGQGRTCCIRGIREDEKYIEVVSWITNEEEVVYVTTHAYGDKIVLKFIGNDGSEKSINLKEGIKEMHILNKVILVKTAKTVNAIAKENMRMTRLSQVGPGSIKDSVKKFLSVNI